MSATVVHQFPDGTEFEVNEFTKDGMRVGHTLDTKCRCLPWLFVRDFDGKTSKVRVVHVPDEIAS